jgi:hypothetical protein
MRKSIYVLFSIFIAKKKLKLLLQLNAFKLPHHEELYSKQLGKNGP